MQLISTLLFLISFSVQARVDLPEFITKQSTNKIRYISSDGKVTYYVRGSGALQLSTNYSFSSIIKSNKYTDYQVEVGNQRKYVAVLKDESPNRKINHQKDLPILLVAYGKDSKAPLIANGRNPKFHLKDTWLSYYKFSDNSLNFFNIRNPKASKKRRMRKKFSPFFEPEVLMLTRNDYLHTDISHKGYMAIIMSSTIEKKEKIIYKTKSPANRLEFCMIKDSLYVGEFPHNSVIANSTILKIDLYNNENFNKTEVLYSSPLADIGNMLCINQSIFFIKTLKYESELNLKETEAAKLDLTSKTLKVLTKFKYATQLTQMDKLVLLPIKDKIYILEGNANLLDDGIKTKDKK